jgi:HEAT repeat protein
VVRALAGAGGAASASVPVLVRALESEPVTTIRLEVARALGAIGVASPGVVSVLARSAQVEVNGSNRAAALGALGDLGPAALDALPVIIAGLEDRLYYVRGAAAGALGELGPGAVTAIPRLGHIAASDPIIGVRRTAAAALDRLRSAEAAAIAADARSRDAAGSATCCRPCPITRRWSQPPHPPCIS